MPASCGPRPLPSRLHDERRCFSGSHSTAWKLSTALPVEREIPVQRHHSGGDSPPTQEAHSHAPVSRPRPPHLPASHDAHPAGPRLRRPAGRATRGLRPHRDDAAHRPGLVRRLPDGTHDRLLRRPDVRSPAPVDGVDRGRRRVSTHQAGGTGRRIGAAPWQRQRRHHRGRAGRPRLGAHAHRPGALPRHRFGRRALRPRPDRQRSRADCTRGHPLGSGRGRAPVGPGGVRHSDPRGGALRRTVYRQAGVGQAPHPRGPHGAAARLCAVAVRQRRPRSRPRRSGHGLDDSSLRSCPHRERRGRHRPGTPAPRGRPQRGGSRGLLRRTGRPGPPRLRAGRAHGAAPPGGPRHPDGLGGGNGDPRAPLHARGHHEDPRRGGRGGRTGHRHRDRVGRSARRAVRGLDHALRAVRLTRRARRRRPG